jgi:hypothetical protein
MSEETHEQGVDDKEPDEHPEGQDRPGQPDPEPDLDEPEDE